MNRASLSVVKAFLEERTPGCEATVIIDDLLGGVRASIFISEQEIRSNVGKALDKMPRVDWKAFVKRSKPAVGPHASRATMRKAAGL